MGMLEMRGTGKCCGGGEGGCWADHGGGVALRNGGMGEKWWSGWRWGRTGWRYMAVLNVGGEEVHAGLGCEHHMCSYFVSLEVDYRITSTIYLDVWIYVFGVDIF